MRKRISNKINLEEMASGVNRRRVIQKVIQSRWNILKLSTAQLTNPAFAMMQTVFDELVELVTATSKPFQMVKGKSNVVMFVGLQVFIRTHSHRKL